MKKKTKKNKGKELKGAREKHVSAIGSQIWTF